MASTAGQVIKCKAAVAWKARKRLVIEEVEVAPPQAMEVRIKILSTSLCHTDIHFWKDKGQTQIFPTIFGHEAGGIVESIGEGVTDLAPGDHVILDFTGECKQCTTDLAPGDNVLPIFAGKCKDCAHCKFKGQLRMNRYKGVMINDGKSRFSINGKPIYHFLGTSTFSEYTVVHAGFVVKINPEAPLDKGSGIAVLVGVPDNDVVFQTHSFNLLNKRILKRTFFGDNKPCSDLPSLVEKYMSKKLQLEKFIFHEVPFSEINEAFDYMIHEDSLRCIIHMNA